MNWRQGKGGKDGLLLVGGDPSSGQRGGDAASSCSGREANPVLAGPAAQFVVGSVALKSGGVRASLPLQHVALHHRPGLYKYLAWVNFATSGVFGWVTAHNVGVR